MLHPKEIADANLQKLRQNPYPGRLIVVGAAEDGFSFMILYAILGRSDNSRNRILRNRVDMSIYTEALDLAKVKDPELIIYNAIAERHGPSDDNITVVSNGRQTDAVADGFVAGKNFSEVLCDPTWSYEPDRPNYTPRITAAVYWNREMKGAEVRMSILRKSPNSDECSRNFYTIDDDVPAGYGYCIHTYAGDGDPLPSFEGEPFLVPLPGADNKAVGGYWWDTVLNAENRVALVAYQRWANGISPYICNESGVYRSALEP